MLTALQSLESQRAWQPKREDYLHTACYCEENVYHLCKVLAEKVPQDNLYAVFVSNPAQKVPFWRQRCSQQPGGLAIWDYHTFLAERQRHCTFIWDLDSELPFPCPLQQYEREALSNGMTIVQLPPQLLRRFRVVACRLFLKHFASDRSHMFTGDGWSAPPPGYPCITAASGETMNLHTYIEMDNPLSALAAEACLPAEPYGVVLEEAEFMQKFSQT